MGPMFAIMKYLPRAPWFEFSSSHKCLSESSVVNFLGSILLLFAYYLIVGSHFHYTVDVLVGVLFTGATFFGFHHATKLSVLKGASSSRSCIWKFIKWIERP